MKILIEAHKCYLLKAICIPALLRRERLKKVMSDQVGEVIASVESNRE